MWILEFLLHLVSCRLMDVAEVPFKSLNIQTLLRCLHVGLAGNAGAFSHTHSRLDTVAVSLALFRIFLMLMNGGINI